MPRYYSATEPDALKWIRNNTPKLIEDIPHFDKEQVQAFLNIIDGDIPLFKDGSNGKPRDQPLFYRSPEQPPNLPTALKLLPEPQFRVSHDKVFNRYKEAQQHCLIKDPSTSHALPSEGPPGQTWIRRPCSESSSPGSSSSSWSLNAPNTVISTLHEENEMIDKSATQLHTKSATKDVHKSTFNKDDSMHDDSDDPESVLTYMDTAFSKWSHAKREGIDAITGIVMGAPPETHTTLAHWDKASCQKASRHFSQMITADNHELLSPDNLAAQTNPGDRAYVTLLHNSLPHRNDSRAATQKVLCSDIVVINDFSSSAEHPTQKQQYGSKRAALIAKDKAISKNTVLVAQSASQKRSAQQKKKNRKSTMPPPSSIKRSKQECKSKTEQHSETEQHQHQSGSTLLIYNDTEDGRRDAITLALKAGIIDPNKINHSDALYQMMALGDAKSPTESNKQIVKRHAEERGIGLRGVSHDEHRKKRQNVQDTNN